MLWSLLCLSRTAELEKMFEEQGVKFSELKNAKLDQLWVGFCLSKSIFFLCCNENWFQEVLCLCAAFLVCFRFWSVDGGELVSHSGGGSVWFIFLSAVDQSLDQDIFTTVFISETHFNDRQKRSPNGIDKTRQTLSEIKRGDVYEFLFFLREATLNMSLHLLLKRQVTYCL